MKKRNLPQQDERSQLILAIMNVDPTGEEQSSSQNMDGNDENRYNGDSQEINKDPIIGGADDVYRERASNDLRDSDLVDEEPLQGIDDGQSAENMGSPLNADEEDADVVNQEETQDLMGEDSEIDDETTI